MGAHVSGTYHKSLGWTPVAQTRSIRERGDIGMCAPPPANKKSIAGRETETGDVKE